jgi:hypothetical protein
VAPATGTRASVGIGDVVVSGVPVDDEDTASPTEQLCRSLAASFCSEDIQDQFAAAHVITAMKDSDEAPLARLLHAH